ncbi:hypothetical protein D3C75_1228950 [compost metagenome]
MCQVNLVLLRVLVEERHEGAVGDKRCDAVGLVGDEFECANPQENDADCQSHKRSAKGIHFAEEP